LLLIAGMTAPTTPGTLSGGPGTALPTIKAHAGLQRLLAVNQIAQSFPKGLQSPVQCIYCPLLLRFGKRRSLALAIFNVSVSHVFMICAILQCHSDYRRWVIPFQAAHAHRGSRFGCSVSPSSIC
jgi:hypothetical protein